MILALSRQSINQVFAGSTRDTFGAGVISTGLHCFGGTDNVTALNDHWVTTDKGVTFTQLANAPWSGRNEMGTSVRGDKIFMWGGIDAFGVTTPQSYSYDPINGWVLISANMGAVFGNRRIFAYCDDGTYFYAIAGGLNNIVRSPDLTTNSWVQASVLPTSFQNKAAASACVFNGAIYLAGGSTAPGPVYTNSILRSTDQGASFQEIASNPIFGCDWPVFGVTNDAIWYEIGTINSANQKGNYWSIDGKSWPRLKYELSARHGGYAATSIDGTEVYIVAGVGNNDAWIGRRLDV